MTSARHRPSRRSRTCLSKGAPCAPCCCGRRSSARCSCSTCLPAGCRRSSKTPVTISPTPRASERWCRSVAPGRHPDGAADGSRRPLPRAGRLLPGAALVIGATGYLMGDVYTLAAVVFLIGFGVAGAQNGLNGLRHPLPDRSPRDRRQLGHGQRPFRFDRRLDARRPDDDRCRIGGSVLPLAGAASAAGRGRHLPALSPQPAPSLAARGTGCWHLISRKKGRDAIGDVPACD